jgi:hypothetical protein
MNPTIQLLVVVTLGALLTGCTSKADQEVYEQDVALMAEKQCAARRLKDERFKMANQLRLMEDSLMKNAIPLSDAQRYKSDSIKAALTLQTGRIASQVSSTMDSLFALHYTTIEQRQAFDEAVEKKIGEICH